MSKQYRHIQLPLLGVLVLCLLVGVYMLSSKRSSKAGSSATIVKHKVETPADDALAYWTKDKMRSAKAPDMPNVKNVERKKQPPRRVPRTPHQS